jgi:protocatechuate 3,4-dioxygenase alpha subunit
MSSPTTPSQTVGPFFSIGLERLATNAPWAPEIPGERISISGRILDGDNQPVPDALLEIWQADASGNYAQPETSAGQQNHPEASANNSFPGFARIPTNDRGEFHFTTIKPGRVPGPQSTPQAPHLAITLFMRGLLKHLVTRLYFAGEPLNDRDHILNLVDPARRSTLIANPSAKNPATFEWNIHLQGPQETVFFDC